MRAEKVTQTLLKVPAITSLVGNRIAETRLPENSSYPALVYEVITGTPVLPISAVGGNLLRVRIQITALARQLADVKSLLEEVRKAMAFKYGSINGVRVTSIVPDVVGHDQKFDDAGIFAQSRDFFITVYED